MALAGGQIKEEAWAALSLGPLSTRPYPSLPPQNPAVMGVGPHLDTAVSVGGWELLCSIAPAVWRPPSPEHLVWYLKGLYIFCPAFSSSPGSSTTRLGSSIFLDALPLGKLCPCPAPTWTVPGNSCRVRVEWSKHQL